MSSTPMPVPAGATFGPALNEAQPVPAGATFGPALKGSANPFDTPFPSELSAPASPAPQATANPFDTPFPSELSAPSDQSSSLGRFVSGAYHEIADPVASAFHGVVDPPQTATEHVLANIGGPGAIGAYRLAQHLVDSTQTALKAKPQEFRQAAQDVQQAVKDFHDNNYRQLASDAGTLLGDTMTATPSSNLPGMGQRVRALSEGSRPGGDLATPLGQTAADLGAAYLGEKVANAEPAAATTPPNGLLKSVAKGAITKGAGVAQPGLRTALADAADASAEDAGVSVSPTSPTQGIRTFMDDKLAAVSKTERGLYDAANEAAETDMKDLYDRQGELQDALDDPTNIANKTSLQNELNSVNGQIKTGENLAISKGVDAADTLAQAKSATQQRYAMQSAKAKIFNNESVVSGDTAYGTPEEVNVQSAIRNAQNLNKPSKFAPEGSPTRLQQAFGKEGAKNLLQNLYTAQKNGATAVRAQKLAKWAGGIAATAGAGALGYEATH